MVASSAFYTSLTAAQAKEATAATLQTVSERIGSSKSPREAARTDPYTVGLLTAAGTDAAIANEVSTTLATGQETGPRGEMALRVLAMVGRGGIQNIRDLLTLPGVDLSIIPTILVKRLRAQRALGDAGQKLVYIAPLYTEELHILARSDVQSIADLAGKTVNLGPEGSTTDILGRELLASLDVRVKDINVSQPDALERMQAGETAATFFIEGKPVNWLTRYRRETGFHLVPVSPSMITDEEYLPATLTSDDYPNLIASGEPVHTLAILSALMVYDWPEGSSRRRLLSTFVDAFFSRFSEFQATPSHPKWKEVNLASTLPGWQRFGPAERWLRRHHGSEARSGSGSAESPQSRSVPNRPQQRR
jgi:TRAP-type uncharacterized transport system substrate-binding protein